MKVVRLTSSALGRPAETSLFDVTRLVESSPSSLPFSDDAVEFWAEYARALSRRSRDDGDSQALAFWLRRASLLRMKNRFDSMSDPEIVVVPRGLIFHIPPSNVDTVFCYSFAIAHLMGNKNIVRISESTLEKMGRPLQLLLEMLSGSPRVSEGNVLLTYSSGCTDITASFSNACDVRVIWGGDETVSRIRQCSIRPHAKDVTFGHKNSMCALSVEAYNSLTDSERERVVERFFNDVYWFDQQGCSSPRVLIWIGGNAEQVSIDFHARLSSLIIRHQSGAVPQQVMSKLIAAYRDAIDQDISQMSVNPLHQFVIQTRQIPDLGLNFPGFGYLYETRLQKLEEILDWTTRSMQTLTTFGFSHEELGSLARSLRGRGIDRIVPVGQALTFNQFWDGYDLMAEFTRLVHVPVN